jgi:hypothetical protein
MTPHVTKNPDGSLSFTVDPETAVAVAASIQEANLEKALPLLEALIGSPRWLINAGAGSAGAIARETYDSYRQAVGLAPIA